MTAHLPGGFQIRSVTAGEEFERDVLHLSRTRRSTVCSETVDGILCREDSPVKGNAGRPGGPLWTRSCPEEEQDDTSWLEVLSPFDVVS
jgi:hypothetical protein